MDIRGVEDLAIWSAGIHLWMNEKSHSAVHPCARWIHSWVHWIAQGNDSTHEWKRFDGSHLFQNSFVEELL